MFTFTHAGLGYAMGFAVPGSDRRLRVWCTAAAALPDADAVTYLFGADVFAKWHHTFGHNAFLGAAVMALAAWHHRNRSPGRRIAATLVIGAAFASHLLTDMKFSGWAPRLLWPVDSLEYQFAPNYGLWHPINVVFAAVFLLLPWLLILWKRVTPLDLVSPRLDRIVIDGFRKGTSSCATCGRLCNLKCEGCQASTCMRHARISWRFRVFCLSCESARRGGYPGASQ